MRSTQLTIVAIFILLSFVVIGNYFFASTVQVSEVPIEVGAERRNRPNSEVAAGGDGQFQANFSTQALDACVDLGAGDVCVVNDDPQQQQGVCEYIEEDLICLPNREAAGPQM